MALDPTAYENFLFQLGHEAQDAREVADYYAASAVDQEDVKTGTKYRNRAEVIEFAMGLLVAARPAVESGVTS